MANSPNQPVPVILNEIEDSTLSRLSSQLTNSIAPQFDSVSFDVTNSLTNNKKELVKEITSKMDKSEKYLFDISNNLQKIASRNTIVKVECVNGGMPSGSGSPSGSGTGGGSGSIPNAGTNTPPNNNDDTNKLLQSILDVLKEQGKNTPDPNKGEPSIPKDVDSKNLSKSERKSLEEALAAIRKENAEREQRIEGLLNSFKNFFKSFVDLYLNNCKEILNKWDAQIAHLKELGVGAQSAVAINRSTYRTMESTDEALKFNISIDKAIKATNEMISAGINPRYARENNKNLITGLSAIGLQLDKNTLKEIGNQIYTNTQFKDLTKGWSRLTSAETENGFDKNDLSRFLNSQEYKKVLALVQAQTGTSRAEAELYIQSLFEKGIRSGAFNDNEQLWQAGMIDLQTKFGGGAYTHIPQEISTMIGVNQIANPNWDLRRDGIIGGMAQAVQNYNSNIETQKKLDQVSAALSANGNFYIWSNMQNNLGLPRHIATDKEVKEGMYEGFIPRMAKATMGMFPAESMGAVSQSLTGNSGFFTQQGSALLGGITSFGTSLLGSAIAGKIGKGKSETYLEYILKDTNKLAGSTVTDALGGDGKTKKLFTGIEAQLGLLAVGLTMVMNNVAGIYTSYQQSEQAKKDKEQNLEKLEASIGREESLRQQYNKARSEGNEKLANEVYEALQKQRELTSQLSESVSLNDRDDKQGQGKFIGGTLGTVGGGVGGGIAGAKLGATVGAFAGPLGIAVGAALGAGIFGLLGLGIGGAIGSASKDSPEETESFARREYARKNRRGYEFGGIIKSEDTVQVAEKNKPEAILPLTNYNRTKDLLKQAAETEGTAPEVKEMLNNATEPEIKTVDKGSEKAFNVKDRMGVKTLRTLAENTQGYNNLANDALGNLPDSMLNSTLASIVGMAQGNIEEIKESAEQLADEKEKNSIANVIVENAKALVNAHYPYIMGNKNPYNHPENGIVCDQFVNFCYRNAGIEGWKDVGTVSGNLASGKWQLTEEPRAGYVVFSNYGLNDHGKMQYKHLGIVGFGDTRYHASSKYGFTQETSLDSLLKSERKKDKKPIFGYLKGLNYGLGTEAKPLDLSSPDVQASFTSSQAQGLSTSTDISSEMGNTEQTVEPKTFQNYNKLITQRLRFANFIKNYEPETNSLNGGLVYDLLRAKLFDYTPDMSDALDKNNPFGLKEGYGELQAYSSYQEGVDAFVKKMENMYDALEYMNYEKQLSYLKENNRISSGEMSKVQSERIISSMDRLSRAVEDSNNMNRMNRANNAPNRVLAGRNYV